MALWPPSELWSSLGETLRFGLHKNHRSKGGKWAKGKKKGLKGGIRLQIITGTIEASGKRS